MPRTSRAGTVPLITSVLGAGFIAGIIPAGLLPANVLNIEHTYHLSHTQMGRITGLCMVLGGATGGLLGGWMCGRIGALRTLLLAIVMATVSLGTIGLVENLHATVFGLAGYFFAMGFMGSSNTLATQMLSDRQRGIALLHALNAVGKLAGPMLALVFLSGAWRLSFLLAAALPVMLAFPALVAYRNGDGKSVGRKHDGDGRPGIAFWAAISAFAFMAGSEIAVALWIPAFGENVRGYSEAGGKMLLSFWLIGMIGGRFASGALSRRLSSLGAMVLCGISLVFAIPAVVFPSYAVSAFFFLLFGLAFSAMWPSYFAHISHVFPEHLGLMGGAAVFSTQIGFALCSWVSGRLADINLTYPILFGASVMATSVLVFFASPLSRVRERGV